MTLINEITIYLSQTNINPNTMYFEKIYSIKSCYNPPSVPFVIKERLLSGYFHIEEHEKGIIPTTRVSGYKGRPESYYGQHTSPWMLR